MFPFFRSLMRRSAWCALAVVLSTALAEPGHAKGKSEELLLLQERVTLLETQMAEIHQFLTRLGYGDDSKTDQELANLTKLVIPATIAKKRFQAKDPAAGRYEDYLHIDVIYDTRVLTKPATALKGTLQFNDLFGELRFELPATLSARIEPGDPVPHKGLRFEYNQFRRAHQWMHGTDSKDMMISLRVAAVNYEDGTSTEYAPTSD